MLTKKNIFHVIKKKNQGMSMIELLLVFTLAMGMLVGVLQLYRNIQASQKKSATKTLITQIKSAIEQFKNDIGRYPSKLEELVTGPTDGKEKRRWSEEAIDKKNIIDGTIKDTYGNEIVYTYDKAKNNFDLYSWGPKGVGSESDQIFAD